MQCLHQQAQALHHVFGRRRTEPKHGDTTLAIRAYATTPHNRSNRIAIDKVLVLRETRMPLCHRNRHHRASATHRLSVANGRSLSGLRGQTDLVQEVRQHRELRDELRPHYRDSLGPTRARRIRTLCRLTSRGHEHQIWCSPFSRRTHGLSLTRHKTAGQHNIRHPSLHRPTNVHRHIHRALRQLRTAQTDRSQLMNLNHAMTGIRARPLRPCVLIA